MNPYNVRFAQTLEATLLIPLFALLAHANRSLVLTEIDIEAMGTASAAAELGIYRVATAGVTPPAPVVPVPLNANVPAFGGLAYAGAWTTNPLKGALVHNCPLNANGQRYFWRAARAEDAIVVQGGGLAIPAAQLALFSISGTVAVAGRLQFREL